MVAVSFFFTYFAEQNANQQSITKTDIQWEKTLKIM